MAKQQGPIGLGWAGGVNLLVDPHAIRDDQLANGKNVWPNVDGVLAKRQAVTFERVAIKDPSTGYKPIAMFAPDPQTGFDFVIHYADDTGNEHIRAGRFDNDTEATTPHVQVATGAPDSYRPMSFINYRGAVIAVGAGNEGFYQLTQSSGSGDWAWHHVSFDWKAYDAATTQTQAIGVRPKVVGVYRDRLVFANFGRGKGHWLVFADRDTPWAYQSTSDDAHRDNVPMWSQVGPDVLLLNGFHVEVVAIQGQDILSVEEVSTSSVADALQTACFIRTSTRGVLATGEIAETVGQSSQSSYFQDWEPALIQMDCGIAGAYATCRTPHGIFWASGDDVFALYDTSPKPVAIGTNIRPALKACPPSLQKFWHMAYSNGCVFLSLATSDSTDELNLSVQHWRLDIRPTGDGDETAHPMGASVARWFGPQDYSNLPSCGPANSVAQMGACIVAKRGSDNQDVVYGLWFGPGDIQGSGDTLCLVSFDRVYQGRDVPYREVVSGRQWTTLETVVVGDVIMPTPLKRNGKLYVYTAAGQSGAAEITYPLSGLPTADGSAYLDEIQNAFFDGSLDSRLSFITPNAPGTSTVQAILMAPDFKEISLGDHQRTKVMRRADIAAFAGAKQQVWMDLLANGGDLRYFMGPCVIGGPTFRRTVGAKNILGVAEAGLLTVAQEFQARCMRPNRSTASGDVGISANIVPAGRTLQPRLRDGQGFVIDETNDYIVWGVFHNAGGLDYGPAQVQVTHGYYANMDDLMAAICTALNSITPTNTSLGGFMVHNGVTPWTTLSPYSNITTYMTNLTLNWDGGRPGGPTKYVGLLCAYDPTEAIRFSSLPIYMHRCMNLLAMLGYDTSAQYATAAGTTIRDDFSNAISVVGECQSPASTTATTIYGIQTVPYTKPVTIQVTELTADVFAKPGRPLGLGSPT